MNQNGPKPTFTTSLTKNLEHFIANSNSSLPQSAEELCRH